MYPFSITDIINRNSQPVDEYTILELFKYQAERCAVYKKYIELLGVKPEKVKTIGQIPFLPVEFFKTKKIYSSEIQPDAVFIGSGTSGSETGKHFVADVGIYRRSYVEGFDYFYGNSSSYAFLALLPSYLERQGSSLITMAEGLIAESVKPYSGFFLYDHRSLFEALLELKAKSQKTILMGVSFALLDFAENYSLDFPDLIVMETGGMKGRKTEIPRAELHSILKKAFGVPAVHSEYGMTELLSQAYSRGDGLFFTPPWMRVIIRDMQNPLKLAENNRTGGINVIDSANVNSCSFIETQDLGKLTGDGSFEVLGRFDLSDIRGCNLMAV